MKILAILLILIPSLGLAGTPLNPPKKYRHYDGIVIEKRLSVKKIDEICDELINDARRPWLGCSKIIVKDVCLIIYPRVRVKVRGMSLPPRKIKQHELGHCAGWGRDHSRK